MTVNSPRTIVPPWTVISPIRAAGKKPIMTEVEPMAITSGGPTQVSMSVTRVRHDSDASAIARAIGHIRGDIRSPIAIPDLARRVGMSASSFHKHFKAITSTTPLQYQKELRLLEARRLLKTGGASVTTAAFEVGYESSSQFSREYARKFGVPPSHDMANGAP